MTMITCECTEKCQSNHLIDQCTSALTKCTDDQFKVLCQFCTHSLAGVDRYGRNVLHVAASMGKTELVEWMVNEGAVPTVTDQESNWTALHRSLFYGHLSTARTLISLNPSCLNTPDNEGRTPLDLVTADRYCELSYSPQNDLCSFGENVNFTLGHTSEHTRTIPDSVVLDDAAGVADVVMCKYHSLVLTPGGRVFSCGHGWGGRLGHGHHDEQTVLRPKMIQSLKNDTVTAIAASNDHSVFLTDKNLVYTCGLNDCHQLGHDSPKILQPKALKFKPFRDHVLLGVCAGRFHTVVYASDALFTFGLNAGQLGHFPGETYQITPRLVSGIDYKTMSITRVVSSDAAVLVHTKQGDLILTTEFKIRKIAANWTQVEKIMVCGGKLDHRTDMDSLKEFGGSEVSVGVLNRLGQLFLWKSSDPCLRRVNYSGLPWLSPRDASISKTCLFLASMDGQVFKASLPAQRRKMTSKKHTKKELKDFTLDYEFKTLTLTELCSTDETCYVDLVRVKGVHRATNVYLDRKAQNFMIIQNLANQNLTLVPEVEMSNMAGDIGKLYSETSADDVIHDVVLISTSLHLPAHRFILSSRSSYFDTLFRNSRPESDQILHVDVSDLGNCDILVQLIQFMYKQTCDLLLDGTKFRFTLQLPENTSGISSEVRKPASPRGGSTSSAYVVYKSNSEYPNMPDQEFQFDVNPIRMLREMGKALGVKGLLDKVENLCWLNGKVCLKDKSRPHPKTLLTFNRRKMSHLFDIRLQSEDGQIFNCHKCMLVSRLEYFNSMLTSGWMETEQESSLIKLPVDGSVLNVIIHCVYTDDCPDLRCSTNVELVCNVLVAADQFLMERLKQICQVVICGQLTLKNVAELLQFSVVYNAEQLKLSCQQYICLNLTALLEARLLDVLTDDVIEELGVFYRSWVKGMCRRRITPWDEPPTVMDLELLSQQRDVQVTKPETTPKTKSRRRRSSKSVSEDKSKKRESFSEDDVITEVMTSPEVGESSDLSFDMQEVSPELSHHESQSQGASGEACELPVWSRSSSGEVLGLRAIMEEESKKSLHQVSDQRTPSGRKKLSHKQRKRISLAEVETLRTEIPITTPITPVSPPSVCPWSQKPVTSVPSLREVMSEEKSRVSAERSFVHAPHALSPSSTASASSHATRGHKAKEVLSWGLSGRGTRTSSISDDKAEDASAAPEPAPNPWAKRNTAPVNQNLIDIVKEELTETVTLNKIRRKPLHIIQMEEQAIGELTKLYTESNPPDVKITVERMTTKMAAPTWAAQQ